jgi:hypothetical protein
MAKDKEGKDKTAKKIEDQIGVLEWEHHPGAG